MARWAWDSSSYLNVFVPRLIQLTRSAMDDVTKFVRTAFPNRPPTDARNVPELIAMFRSFADVVMPEDLRRYVKVPAIATSAGS